MGKTPEIVTSLEERGFDIEIREHQGYEDVVLVFTSAIEGAKEGSRIQTETQEGTQGIPCTIFDATKGDKRVVFAVSGRTEKPVISNIVAINIALVPAKKASR